MTDLYHRHGPQMENNISECDQRGVMAKTSGDLKVILSSNLKKLISMLLMALGVCKSVWVSCELYHSRNCAYPICHHSC